MSAELVPAALAMTNDSVRSADTSPLTSGIGSEPAGTGADLAIAAMGRITPASQTGRRKGRNGQ